MRSRTCCLACSMALGSCAGWAVRGPHLLVERHQRQEPFMHVLDNRLVAPGMELADGCGNHVEAAPAAGDLDQVNGPMEHGCGLVDVALADMGKGQVPEDDCLGLVTTLEAAGGALQDRPGLGAVTESEI